MSRVNHEGGGTSPRIVLQWTIDDVKRLRLEINSAHGSPGRLGSIYRDLVERLGEDAASQLWWDVFAGQDASET